MASVEPALRKDPLPFQFQDVRVGERPAVDAKQPILLIVDHQALRRTVFHRLSLLWRCSREGLCNPLPETCGLWGPGPVAGHRARTNAAVRAGNTLVTDHDHIHSGPY